MKNKFRSFFDIFQIILGSVLFAIAFDLFLEPYHMNAGGLSGLAMILVHLLGTGTVGMFTMLINIPLFAFGGWKIGKKFFLYSLIGMISSSVAIDACAFLPVPEVEPLVAALYGGVLGGLGLGIVFIVGATTGGSDIIVRFLKRRWPHMNIGTINTCFDLMVVALTGLTFMDMSRALYGGVVVFAGIPGSCHYRGCGRCRRYKPSVLCNLKEDSCHG